MIFISLKATFLHNYIALIVHLLLVPLCMLLPYPNLDSRVISNRGSSALKCFGLRDTYRTASV